MTTDATLPYAALSDEELLSRVYITNDVRTPLEIELATRLEHALDQLTGKPEGIGDFVLRRQMQGET